MEIEYEIKNDNYGGKTIYSKQFIKKDTLIWSTEKSKSIIIPPNALPLYINSLCDKTLLKCLKYSYFDSDGYFIDVTLDDGRFFNHSNENNNIEFKDNASYAKRDIYKGEELLDNYKMYGNEPEWYLNLLKKNNIDMSYMLE